MRGKVLYTSNPGLTDWEILERAHQSGADLKGLYMPAKTLSCVDLNNCDLSNANLQDATLHQSNLRRAKFHGANLFGADLSGSDITGATFFGADMRGMRAVGCGLINLDGLEDGLITVDLVNQIVYSDWRVCSFLEWEQFAKTDFKHSHKTIRAIIETDDWIQFISPLLKQFSK